MLKPIIYKLVILLAMVSPDILAAKIPSSHRSIKAINSVKHRLEKELSSSGLTYGSAIFIRIFKQSSELELWLEGDEGFELYKTYPICRFSGGLGPKTKRGDMQAPEGFYFVPPSRLNPWSSYHLSFNLGYPNRYERHHGFTGSALMVHGKCVSIGCYAMTDKYINEIYALAHGAFENGQAYFRVHVFPFRMEDELMQAYKTSPWYEFWLNLKQGYDWFNQTRKPPNVTVVGGRYHFESASGPQP